MSVMSYDERRGRLQYAMTQMNFVGEITPLPPYQFQVLTRGQKVNHVLHAILTIFTCFLWAIVWLIIAANETKDVRRLVTVDESGGVWIDGKLWWPSPTAGSIEPPRYM